MNNMKYDSMVHVLQQWSLEKPNQTASIFFEKGLVETQRVSFFQLDLSAQQIASYIMSCGIKKGDRVCLIFPPGLELIKALWGCFYAGVAAVLIHPPMNKKLLEKAHRIIHNCMPRAILIPKLLFQRYGALFQKDEYLGFDHEIHIIEYEAIFKSSQFSWTIPSIDINTIALLQYTSGSTNYPKGVMLTHGNLLDNLEKIKTAFGMSQTSRMFSWLPPYHDMGLMGGILSALYTGYPSYLISPFTFLQNPISWLKAISDFKISISGAPNFAYDYCVKKIKDEKKINLDLSSWEVAYNGAEPIHHGTMARFYEAFKACGFRKEAFYPCYGLAEVTLLASSGRVLKPFNILNLSKSNLENNKIIFTDNQSFSKLAKLTNSGARQKRGNAKDKSYQLVSCGEIHHDIRIVNPNTFEMLQEKQIGEVWISSDSVAIGYWNLDEETQQTFHGRIQGTTKGSKYLRTGDLGFFHKNELYITGRIKDLIILYGKNHYPQDIEATIKYSRLDHVNNNCAAFVTTKGPEYFLTFVCELSSQRLTLEEMNQICLKIFELVYEEHTVEIHEIYLMQRNSIPLTTSGKVKRGITREKLNCRELPVLFHWKLMAE